MRHEGKEYVQVCPGFWLGKESAGMCLGCIVHFLGGDPKDDNQLRLVARLACFFTSYLVGPLNYGEMADEVIREWYSDGRLKCMHA